MSLCPTDDARAAAGQPHPTDLSPIYPKYLRQFLIRRLGNNPSLDIQRRCREIAPIPLLYLFGRHLVTVHIDIDVWNFVPIEKATGADGVFTPARTIYDYVRPGTVFRADGRAVHVRRCILRVYEEMAYAVACLGNIALVAIAGTDEIPILHGIARSLLSGTIGPAKGVRLPANPSHDSFPRILVRIQVIWTYLRVA